MARSGELRCIQNWQVQPYSELSHALDGSHKEGHNPSEESNTLVSLGSSRSQYTNVYDPYSSPPSTPRPVLYDDLEKKDELIEIKIKPKPYKPLDPPGSRPYLFDALGKLVVGIIADTLDWDVLANPNYKFSATSVTPGNILHGLGNDNEVYYFLWVATKKLVDENIVNGRLRQDSVFKTVGDLREAVLDQFLAELGNGLMDVAQGAHITFIDPRKHMHTDSIRAQAQKLIARFESLGRQRSTILVAIPATLHGIAAAITLQDEDGINVNLAHVAGVTHAAACAEAGVAAVSLPIAPTHEWYDSRFGGSHPDREENGSTAIQEILATAAFYQQRDIQTMLIGTQLRHENDTCALVTLDMLSFDGTQATRAEWYNCYPRMAFELPAPAISRADEVSRKLPSSLLSHKHGFYGALPASDISMVDSILYKAIGGMTTEVQAIHRCIQREVEWQIRLTQPTLSLNNSLTFMSPQPPSNKADQGAAKRKRESSENTPPKSKKTRQNGGYPSTWDEVQRTKDFSSTGREKDVSAGYAEERRQKTSSWCSSSWEGDRGYMPVYLKQSQHESHTNQRSSPSPSPTGSPQEEVPDPFDEVF